MRRPVAQLAPLGPLISVELTTTVYKLEKLLFQLITFDDNLSQCNLAWTKNQTSFAENYCETVT